VAEIRPNLDLLPANVWSHEEELAFLDLLGADPTLLRRVLDPVVDRYEVILLDCPPGLGPMTRAALIAADRYLVPVQAESMNMGTLPRLELLADRVRQDQNPGLTLEGYVATMVDARTRHATDILEELSALYSDRFFKTSIPRSVRVAEESARGRPSVAARARTRAAEAFQALAEEMLFRQASRASSPPKLRVVESGGDSSGTDEPGDWSRSAPVETPGARLSGFEFSD
jgi:chromosome partitioning protein